MNQQVAEFDQLGPDKVIDAVEAAIGQKMTGFTSPLPSYINRVYELQSMAGERVIGKFYRPGRWHLDAIREEHEFMQDCHTEEVPVVLPMTLENGQTVGQVDDIPFAVFPKRLGREFEINTDEDWVRIGTQIARMHSAGMGRKAEHRIQLHPLRSTKNDVEQLTSGGFIPLQYKSEFLQICHQIIEISAELFKETESIRIHGDCHNGNILHRPETGILLIDFDDMAMGPPIQDLWLLLPEYADKCRREIELIIEGYEVFRSFDRNSLKLIEPLRAMRIIYFLAWCSRQAKDQQFQKNFPGWGSDGFWSIEVNGLTNQLHIIIDSLKEDDS